MLNFSRLRTPPNDGDVLVEPTPSFMAQWAFDNHELLTPASVEILKQPLSAWRAETRRALASDVERPVIVLGHQPEFLHAGVWSKHVVAQRLARAIGGVAVNLIVDNDAPRTTALQVPVVDDAGVHLRSISTVDARAGYAHEQMGSISEDEVAQFADCVRAAMGDRYAASCMDAYFAGLLSTQPMDASRCGGWVDQHVAGRRAIERLFKFELVEHRVSDVAYTPLLVDICCHAERFHASYNKALASYRAAERIRGARHPIPDLSRRGDVIEIPYWVYRRCEVRRRLMVRRSAESIQFYADRDAIGAIPVTELRSGEDLRDLMVAMGDWRIRPRALTLTLWARLFIADLFIHGIGGAKYDRITDAIIRDYFGMTPPKMGCVSATLHLDLPLTIEGETDVRAIEHALRDMRFNPQRYLDLRGGGTEFLQQRAAAIAESDRLRRDRSSDRSARRSVFRRIRALNEALVNAHPDAIADLRRRKEQTKCEAEVGRIARGREYFFGLHSRSRLGRLLDAIPHERQFAV